MKTAFVCGESLDGKKSGCSITAFLSSFTYIESSLNTIYFRMNMKQHMKSLTKARVAVASPTAQ